MDAMTVLPDLQALKRLYGLLQNAGSDLMDDRARLLLKNILDAEATKVFKPHSEVFAEASQGFSPTQKQQHDQLTGVSGNHVKDKDWNRENVIERQAETSTANGPDYRHKRCRICQRNTVKNSDHDKVTNFDDATLNRNRFAAQLKNPSESGTRKQEDEVISSNDAAKELRMEKGRQTTLLISNATAESERKLQKVDSLCEEASKSIERIELFISALQREANHLRLHEEGFAGHKFFVPETKPDSAIDLRQQDKDSLSGNRDVGGGVGYIVHHFPFMPAEEMNQLYMSKLVLPTKAMLRQSSGDPLEELGEGGRALMHRVSPFNLQNISGHTESGNLIMTCNGSPYYNTYSPATFPLASKEDAPMMDRIIICKESEKGHRGKTRAMVEREDGNLIKHIHFSNIARASSFKGQESEESATNYSYSYSSSSRGSRDYSHRDLEYVGSNMSIDSGFVSPISHTAGSEYSSYTSNTGDEAYSSSSVDEVTSSSSYKSLSSSSSSCNQPKKLKTAAKMARMDSRRTRKGNGAHNMKKHRGMWRRLKDRLAIIFHHHHHHHHHHHAPHKHCEHGSSDGHGKVMTRKLSKRREDEANGEKAVEKVRRSSVQDKNQHAHFRDLVDGFMRHIRSSKQPKPEIETVSKLVAKGKLGRNKSHWWQLMQHHRGAAKLANRTSFKIGLGKKKIRPKALPSFK